MFFSKIRLISSIILLFCLSCCGSTKLRNTLITSKEITITGPESLEIIPSDQITVVVVIDVFRAFTTAAHILKAGPKVYILASKSSVLANLAEQYESPLLIGKAEKGTNLVYDIPNSPTRLQDLVIRNRNVLHRTQAGANGVLLAKKADVVLLASFVNATATAQYIKSLQNPRVIILPMGHEGLKPSLEDELCAQYIKKKLEGKKLDISKYIAKLKTGSGSYFFAKDQYQYPSTDFNLCLEIDSFNFAIIAKVLEDYSILSIGH
jgi:2-phosphosulfolactate phosphatase